MHRHRHKKGLFITKEIKYQTDLKRHVYVIIFTLYDTMSDDKVRLRIKKHTFTFI